MEKHFLEFKIYIMLSPLHSEISDTVHQIEKIIKVNMSYFRIFKDL